MKFFIMIIAISISLLAFNNEDYEIYYGGKYDIKNTELHKLIITPTENGYLTITTYMAPSCEVKLFNNHNKMINQLSILNGYKIEKKVKEDENYYIWIIPKNRNCKYVLINFP